MNSSDDEIALKQFEETLTFKDGRYSVTWPWKTDQYELPENKGLAVGRLKSLLSKLTNKPELLRKYNEIIQEQHENGIIERVTPTQSDGKRHFIPHHAVVKDDKATTKVRIVYDASAKSKKDNKSLNECLYRGPVLLQDLCGLLMRFRLHKVGLVADIEKAFLQIGLQVPERDVTRFLWLKNPSEPFIDSGNLQEYRFCRVPFGVISSPFLLGATVNYHLDNYGSELAKQLKKDIYMDNVITGVSCVSEAESVYKEAKMIFNDASMNLREWATNESTLNKVIPDKDQAQGGNMPVLGIMWDKIDDTLYLKGTKLVKGEQTKRVALKQIS